MPTESRRLQPIGVFDSGVGGLTVLHELLVALPNEDFLYVGDTARFPYGSRTTEELQEFAVEIADELVERGAKLLVVACNSATAAALPLLQERFGSVGRFDRGGRFDRRARGQISVIGVVGPEVQAAVVASRNGRVGLLATPATVASGAYDEAMSVADSHVRLTSVACPDLAAVIQQNLRVDERIVAMVKRYCEPLKAEKVDTVILGCTHFPLVRPLLQRILGRGVTLIAPGQAIARRVECALAARELSSPREIEGSYRFLSSGDPDSFRDLGTHFLQLPVSEVEQLDFRPIGSIAR